jgi:hypothetical protein
MLRLGSRKLGFNDHGVLTARSILVRLVLTTMAIGGFGEVSCADTKVALVIGNAKYQSADVLKNPANDAVSVKNALVSIGFNVTLKQDLTVQDSATALIEFARDASKSDIALFYFAGSIHFELPRR